MRYNNLLDAYLTREGSGSYYNTVFKVEVDSNEKVISAKKINTSNISYVRHHLIDDPSEDRMRKLLKNMKHYLGIEYAALRVNRVDLSKKENLEKAYHFCLSHILEKLENDIDLFLFEGLLGFSKEELIGEGLGWFYEHN
jgi:hypothetical protein